QSPGQAHRSLIMTRRKLSASAQRAQVHGTLRHSMACQHSRSRHQTPTGTSSQVTPKEIVIRSDMVSVYSGQNAISFPCLPGLLSKQQPQTECQPLGPEVCRFGNTADLIAWPGHTAPVQEVVPDGSAAIPVELVSRIDIHFGNHGES